MAKKIVNAKTPLRFEILPKHVKLARKCDATGCVVAQALLDSVGEMLEAVYVGSNVTKIVTDTRIIRYRTPGALKAAIPDFDRTGEWSLKPGPYSLNVYKAENRHRYIKDADKKPGKLARFTGEKRQITRKVMSVDTLAALRECK